MLSILFFCFVRFYFCFCSKIFRFVIFRVTLAEPLKAQATQKVVVRMVFIDVQQPHPASISQNDVQLVRYGDNHYYAAPYMTSTQRTSVKLASSAVESFSQLQPTTRKGAEIIYGPYEDVAAFSSSPLRFASLGSILLCFFFVYVFKTFACMPQCAFREQLAVHEGCASDQGD
jgi:hypothetical protein